MSPPEGPDPPTRPPSPRPSETPDTDDDTPGDRDADPHRAVKAAPDWNADNPAVEAALEHIHDRIYGAWKTGSLRVSEDVMDALGDMRLHKDEYLTTTEQAMLKRLETEIEKVQAGTGPNGVVDTTELDTAWCVLLLEAYDREVDHDLDLELPDRAGDPDPDPDADDVDADGGGPA